MIWFNVSKGAENRSLAFRSNFDGGARRSYDEYKVLQLFLIKVFFDNFNHLIVVSLNESGER